MVRVGTEASAELAADLQQQQSSSGGGIDSAPSPTTAPPSPESVPESYAPEAPLSAADARRVVDSVFERCYNDLAPFGRRLRGRGHNSVDARHALELKHLREALARLYSSSPPKTSDSH